MSTTIEHGDFTVTSNHETADAMRAALEISNDPAESNAAVGETGPAPHSSDSGNDAGSDSAVVETGHSGDSGGSKPSKQPKPRENVQARISQAVAKQHDAERKAAELEARLAALEQARNQPPPGREEPRPAPKAPEPTGKPSWKAFEAKIGETYETWGDAQDAYSEAREDWFRQQWQREQREQAEMTARQQAGKSHLERVEKAKTTYPDYDAVVSAVSDIPVTQTLEAAILALPNSADAVYWLASHRDELTQLARETAGLGVEAAPLVRRLLEARLGAGERSGSAPGVELSKAKPPVRPVGVSSVVVPEEPGDDEPFDAYFARMNAADRKKGR